MEAFLKSVKEDVFDDIKGSIEDPESRNALLEIITKAIIQNKERMPGGAFGGDSQSGPAPLTKKTVTSGAKSATGYNLHWADWKEQNNSKDYPDPKDSSKTLTAHKYWQKHVWPNLDKDEKDEYNNRAKDIRAAVNKSGGGKAATKRSKPSKSAYQLFLAKMKDVMDKDEEFEHPETRETIKLHRYLIYVWNNSIKNDAELKEPFETYAKDLKESEDSENVDLSELPFLDPEKLRAGDLKDLELHMDD
tara:strand:- start:5492 stop:6235 length:744 start_codon:yes stop_codon:yes gene_type:complete